MPIWVGPNAENKSKISKTVKKLTLARPCILLYVMPRQKISTPAIPKKRKTQGIQYTNLTPLSFYI